MTFLVRGYISYDKWQYEKLELVSILVEKLGVTLPTSFNWSEHALMEFALANICLHTSKELIQRSFTSLMLSITETINDANMWARRIIDNIRK